MYVERDGIRKTKVRYKARDMEYGFLFFIVG